MVVSSVLRSAAAAGTSSPIAFMCALALRSQPRATLHALYQGWIDAVQALNAARVTGEFAMPGSAAAAARRAAAIDAYRSLDARIAKLLAEARRERQLSRRVAMNLELAELRKKRRAALQDLEVEGNERMSRPRSIDTGPLSAVKTQETA